MDYIATYYQQTLSEKATPYSRLTHQIEVDCCVIGAGISGLSVAAELIEQGLTVAVLESHRVAWGASGRNGGFVSPGFALSYPMIRKKVGTKDAKELYKLSIEGMRIIQRNIESLGMQDVLQSEGELDVIRYKNDKALHERKHYSQQDFDLHLDVLDSGKLNKKLHSDAYFGAIFNPDAFQIHPLNYCIHLARSLANKGAQIYEQSFVEVVKKTDTGFTVMTAHGEVRCRDLVYCTSAYSGDIEQQIKRAIIPISTHVMLSKDLDGKLNTAISTTSGVLDDRRASDYYRVVEGDKLLWGGHITTIEPSPQSLKATMKKRLLNVYPQLTGVQDDVSWSGKMGYAKHKMPFVGKLNSGAWVCTAFGGHGLNTSSICGQLVAQAVAGTDTRYTLFAPFGLDYNFGLAGKIAVQLSYWGYQLQDWWKETQSRLK